MKKYKPRYTVKVKDKSILLEVSKWLHARIKQHAIRNDKKVNQMIRIILESAVLDKFNAKRGTVTTDAFKAGKGINLKLSVELHKAFGELALLNDFKWNTYAKITIYQYMKK